MRIFTLYGTTLRVHPLFLLLLLLHLLAGQGVMIAACLLALALHEAGHCAAASRLHIPVAEIELTPFGGAMQIAGSDGLTGCGGLLLAGAGVLVNLLCLTFSFFLLQGRPTPFFVWFAAANAAMLAVNLLPALPLDGGRMALAALAPRFGRPKVFQALLTLGRLIAGLLIAWSLILALRGAFRPTWMMLGCSLLYAAALEEKHGAARYISALFSRRFRIDNGAALPVQYLCAASGTALYTLVSQLRPGAYHLIAVLDDRACGILGMVDEGALCEAVLHAPNATLKQILASKPQK